MIGKAYQAYPAYLAYQAYQAYQAYLALSIFNQPVYFSLKLYFQLQPCSNANSPFSNPQCST